MQAESSSTQTPATPGTVKDPGAVQGGSFIGDVALFTGVIFAGLAAAYYGGGAVIRAGWSWVTGGGDKSFRRVEPESRSRADYELVA